MEVSCRATRMLLEAAEAEGLPRKRVIEGSTFDEAHLTDTRGRVDWDTLTALCDRVSTLLDHDPRRLHAIGAGLLVAPANHLMQKLSATFVSVEQVYELADKWMGPAMLPQLRVRSEMLPDGRRRSVGELAPGLSGSVSFFHICAGSIMALPCMLGLPHSTAELEVSPRRLVLLLTLPRSQTLVQRVRHAIRATLTAREIGELLEEQRRELDRSFTASLRANEDFRVLLENLPDLVLIHRGGKILWANRALVAVLGYETPQDLVGQATLSLLHPDDRERGAEQTFGERAPGSPATAGPAALVQFRLLRRDGATIVAELAPGHEVSFRGAAARMVAGRDVTEHVRMQQQLLLADRMASLGMLAAGVAHEINNPLAYAMGSVELAARHLGTGRGEEAALGALRTALDGLERVRAIVKDLKTFSRGDQDTLGEVDVRAALESTLTLAGSQIAGRTRVVRDYGDTPRAWANAARLGQVFLNLVINAIEAMPEGGDNELGLRTGTDAEGRVVVDVKDTGEGIAKEDLARIFEPFFTTKPVGSGTGLGLAVCHQILTGLGGTIDVTSTRGAGTTFRLTLPAAPDAPAASRPPPAPGSSGRRARVLLVDDEPHFADILRRVLEDHDVTVALSARAALAELLGGGSFDVIVCDLMMPDLAGPEIHAELARSRPELCDRMIFMTGGAFTDTARAFLAQQSNRCLEKPFHASELLALVEARLAG